MYNSIVERLSEASPAGASFSFALRSGPDGFPSFPSPGRVSFCLFPPADRVFGPREPETDHCPEVNRVKEPPPLKGLRRELTRETFEELCALQCRLPEILGWAGTTEEKLARWCRRQYRLPLEEAVEMLRQDGLIEIRRAGFDQLKKSATLIAQQYNRFLNAPPEESAPRTEELARRIFSLAEPGEEELRALFSGDSGNPGDFTDPGDSGDAGDSGEAGRTG